MNEDLQQLAADPSVRQFAAAAAAALVIWGLTLAIQHSLGRRVHDGDTRYRIRKFVSFLGFALAAFAIASIYSDRLGAVSVALGVAGAGVAFALQEVVVSAAGWIALSFGRFYSAGQRIQIGGIKGDVVDIGVFRTTLMEVGQWVDGDLYNGRIVRVANSFLFKEPVFNYSVDFPFLWDEIIVPIHYSSDWRRAEQIVQSCVEEVIGDYPARSRAAWEEMVGKYKLEPASVDPTVTLVADENWYTFTARYIVDYRRRRSTKDRIFTRILEELERTQGAVLMASSSTEISSFPTLTVKQEPPSQ